MIRNFEELIYNLKECEDHIDRIIEGKEKGEAEVGKQLYSCMS